MYKLILLSTDQIKKLYTERMTMDFPANELKPLDMIFKLVSRGRYDCYGLVENEEIIGYAFLNRLEGREDYLVDYLAIASDRRNHGLGAELIELLAQKLVDANSILVEVENPEYATDDSDRKLKTGRVNFYMRNGFRDTNVRAVCFGVPFCIIAYGNGDVKSEEEIKELYKQHYKAMLPKELFDKNVIV